MSRESASSVIKDAPLWGFPGGETVGGAGSDPFPPHSPIICLFVCFISSSSCNEGSEVSSRREAHGSQPLRLASSLHRASSPIASPSLSGSRAAAHMVPCQIPGGSVGHVSGSQQRRRSRVTMETEANGRPRCPRWAGPTARGLDLGVARRTNEREIWVWLVCQSKEDQTCGSPQCGGRPPGVYTTWF